MKTKNAFMLLCFFLGFLSVSYADTPPLKVEVSFEGGALKKEIHNIQGRIVVVAKATNVSDHVVEFYYVADSNWILDNPTILLPGPKLLNSVVREKRILNPSETFSETLEYYLNPLIKKTETKTNMDFRIGFIWLDENYRIDSSKEVIWSNPLTVLMKSYPKI